MEPWQLVLFGVAAVALGYSIYQGALHRRKLQGQDAFHDVQADVRVMESSARGIVQKMEVRAYDYSRDVEARIDNRLLVLDQLIVDADHEIARLQALLAESRQTSLVPDRELTLSEQQRCFALREAGFAVSEIAQCLRTSLSAVEQALSEWQRPGRHAA